jgi:hypothetical protein
VAQNLVVGRLATALAHLHVRNFARGFDWIRFAANGKVFPMAFPDSAQLFQRGGLQSRKQPISQIPEILI